MKPPRFDYLAPRTLDEALAHLHHHGDQAKILAGGQSLIPMLNFRLAHPGVVVDVNRLTDLAYVRQHDGGVAVGALTRQHAVERSELVRARVPVVAEACRFIGPLTTALQPGEMLTEIRIPAAPPRSGGAFVEMARRAGDFALVGVAALVTLDGAGRCVRARIALCGVGPTAVRARAAEDALTGQAPTAAVLDEAADRAAAATSPPSDVHGSAEFRRKLAQHFARQALAAAIQRSGGR